MLDCLNEFLDRQRNVLRVPSAHLDVGRMGDCHIPIHDNSSRLGRISFNDIDAKRSDHTATV